MSRITNSKQLGGDKVAISNQQRCPNPLPERCHKYLKESQEGVNGCQLIKKGVNMLYM